MAEAVVSAVLAVADLENAGEAVADAVAVLGRDLVGRHASGVGLEGEHLLDPRSSDALVDAMGDPALTEIAVRTLKKLSAIRERIEQTLNQLRDVEESSEREEARMAAVIALLPIGRASVEILIEYLEDDDWLVREAAADLLGKIGDSRAVDPLMRRLQTDKDTGVKEIAIGLKAGSKTAPSPAADWPRRM
jgi:HEAT repeat protein